jgi:acetoin utilization deacetylase AcuC-like enzyme
VDVNAYHINPHADPDGQYVDLVRQNLTLIPAFKPDLLIWYYGFDTHRDDYGSLGLTEPAYFAICDLMLAAAAEMGVPLMVVLAGGSMSHLATVTIPEIIRRLAQA